MPWRHREYCLGGRARSVPGITKAAVDQVTRAIAVDYGHQGMRSVALCPGMIDTPMTHWRLAQPALREVVLARIPQRTIGTDPMSSARRPSSPATRPGTATAPPSPIDGGLASPLIDASTWSSKGAHGLPREVLECRSGRKARGPFHQHVAKAIGRFVADRRRERRPCVDRGRLSVVGGAGPMNFC